MGKLENKVVVITGGGTGIGQAIAYLFAHHDALVVIGDKDLTTAQETAANILGDDGKAFALEVDVTSRSNVKSFSDQVINEFGHVDILVNNAGIGHTGSILEVTEEEWDAVMAVNVKGVYLCCHFFLPHMLSRGEGNIINMASVLGLGGVPKRAVYSASKGAIIALTRQMAIEFAKENIRVNCISPGTVNTFWVERLLAEQPDPEAARENLNARHPMGRLAKPEEVAHAALYLASSESAFATGTNLVIDGGANAL